MIVEDDAEVRETLTLLLNSRGYRTFAASDGAQALAIAAEHGVSLDLIVADYNLPGPNGLEIAGKIEEASARKIPVIMLTGDISAATLLEIANKGYVHLYKPADARTLIRHIEGMLAANRREDGAPTVFIADDDREIREAMRDMLEMHGYRTEIFASGASFLDAYSPGRRGCLLADARMPGIGGLELIERLNKMQASLPVIMITAYGDVAIAVKAMKAGAFDFLQKPANPKELLDCIERALNYSPEHPEHSSIQANRNGESREPHGPPASNPSARSRRQPKQEHRGGFADQPAHRGQSSRRNHAENRSEILVRTYQNCSRRRLARRARGCTAAA